MLGKDENGMLTIYEDGLVLLLGARTTTRRTARCRRRVRLELGDGDDWNSFSSDYQASLPVAVYGGEGKDQLQTYNANVVTLDGGGGNDILKGWDSNDTLLGGAGDDEINASGGDDHIEGGDGNDSISPDTYHGPPTTTSTVAPASTKSTTGRSRTPTSTRASRSAWTASPTTAGRARPTT